MLSAFRAKKSKGVDMDKFPKPPNGREILEDIGNMLDDDPIMEFVDLLRTKGGQPTTCPTFFTLPVSVEDTSDTYQNPKEKKEEETGGTTESGLSLNEELAAAVLKDLKPKPHSKHKNPMTFKEASPPAGAETDIYKSLKEFTFLCSKSEEYIEKVEGRIRKLESTCDQILKGGTNTNSSKEGSRNGDKLT